MIICFVSYAHKWKHWHATKVYSFQLPQMNHVDLHQKQDDAKLWNPCIISMPVLTCVNRSIMVVVVAMPTNLKLKVYVNMSAKNTVGWTTLFFLRNRSVIELYLFFRYFWIRKYTKFTAYSHFHLYDSILKKNNNKTLLLIKLRSLFFLKLRDNIIHAVLQ